MPTYEVSVRCKDCGRDHPVLLKLHIKEGPNHKQRVVEYYGGASLPPQVAAIRWHQALCPKTGKKFTLGTDSDIFLVPLGKFNIDTLTH